MGREHTDKEYEGELRSLRETILLMAGRCEEMIFNSVRALVERDSALAQSTMALDDHVDQAEVRADELCLLVLAKRQPVASDLRFITQALKMSKDLERIADLAVNICERVVLLNEEPPLKPYEDVPRMASIVQKMTRQAIDAFVDADTAKAQRVILMDEEVDRLYHQVIVDLLRIMVADPPTIGRGIHILSISKFLERVGDHASNLAEGVVFMVKGKDLRHAPAETKEAE